MAALERFRLAETDANRVRKLNALVDAINALGITDGVIAAAALPLATDTTAGVVIVGSGLTVTDGTVAVSG